MRDPYKRAQAERDAADMPRIMDAMTRLPSMHESVRLEWSVADHRYGPILTLVTDGFTSSRYVPDTRIPLEWDVVWLGMTDSMIREAFAWSRVGS